MMKHIHPELQVYTQVSDNEILAQCGILPHQELIEFCGPFDACYHETFLPFACYDVGVCLKSNMATKLTNISLSNVSTLTFIENYTNYTTYIQTKQKDELVIYHGGFYSPTKAAFYIRLEDALHEHMQVRFWADIDLGGFEMFVRLKKIFTTLTPMRMAKNDYEQQLAYARSVSEEYCTKVSALFEKDDYAIFYDVINVICYHKKVVEQESFLHEEVPCFLSI